MLLNHRRLTFRVPLICDEPNFLAIDPEECIDCTLCVEECPARAIFDEDELPADQRHFLAINAELASRWPVIDRIVEAPSDADDWNGIPNKLEYLDRDEPKAEQRNAEEVADES